MGETIFVWERDKEIDRQRERQRKFDKEREREKQKQRQGEWRTDWHAENIDTKKYIDRVPHFSYFTKSPFSLIL